MNNPMNDSSIDAGFHRSRRDVIVGGALAAVGLGLSGKLAAESPSQSTPTLRPNHPGRNAMNSITTSDAGRVAFRCTDSSKLCRSGSYYRGETS